MVSNSHQSLLCNTNRITTVTPTVLLQFDLVFPYESKTVVESSQKKKSLFSFLIGKQGHYNIFKEKTFYVSAYLQYN